jgi:hypothetical protein
MLPWDGRLRFDHARHRRMLNLARNYVRLNEWPEWYVVDENMLYDVTGASGRTETLLESDLKDGAGRGAGAVVREAASAIGSAPCAMRMWLENHRGG